MWNYGSYRNIDDECFNLYNPWRDQEKCYDPFSSHYDRYDPFVSLHNSKYENDEKSQKRIEVEMLICELFLYFLMAFIGTFEICVFAFLLSLYGG